jgi:AraC-like DNA-binding protein
VDIVTRDGLIADVRVASADEERTVLSEPDHATSILLRDTGELVVLGPRTRAGYFVGAPGRSCLRVRLGPGGARPLLGGSVRDLVDRVVPLTELWGRAPAEELAGLLADGDLSQVGETLSRYRRGDVVDLVREAATLLAGGRDRVATTARRLNVSERHLRTVFTDGVGLSPKQFARIDRVRTVLATPADRRFAQLATDAGYYDQSHMTAEFRTVMGVAPHAFRRGRLPAATRCTA